MFHLPPLHWLHWSPSSLIGVVILGLALFGCSAPSSQPSPTIVEVVDGDTVVVNFNGQPETVRLLGVDTPETVDPNRPVQCFGTEATQFLEDALPPGAAVHVLRDVEARDRFGRLLVYLIRADDGVFINAELLRLGYGDLAIYAPNVAYGDTLVTAHATARTASAGLWGACGGADVALDPPPVTQPVD